MCVMTAERMTEGAEEGTQANAALVESEFLITLQPRPDSELARAFAECREACRRGGFGLDATDLYPPHITVTGFFPATQRQATQVCALAAAELERLVAAKPGCPVPAAEKPLELCEEAQACPECSPSVDLLQVLATDRGYVLVDVQAPGMASLGKALAEKACAHELPHLRPKSVRHISLASGRSAEEQAGVLQIYRAALPLGAAGPWDLVVSQLLVRADPERLRFGGEAHHFQELMRLPLPLPSGGTPHTRAAIQGALQPEASAVRSYDSTKGTAQDLPQVPPMPVPNTAATPMKRRRSLPSDPCIDARVTPPFKVARRRIIAHQNVCGEAPC